MFPFSVLVPKWKKLVDRNQIGEDKVPCVVIDAGGVENMILNPWQTELGPFSTFQSAKCSIQPSFLRVGWQGHVWDSGKGEPLEKGGCVWEMMASCVQTVIFKQGLAAGAALIFPELSLALKQKLNLQTPLCFSLELLKSNTTSGIFFISAFIPLQSLDN